MFPTISNSFDLSGREKSVPEVSSGGASPLFVAGQSQVISRIRKGSQHIDIHVRATFHEF